MNLPKPPSMLIDPTLTAARHRVMAHVNIGGVAYLNEETGPRVTLVLQPQQPFRLERVIVRCVSEALILPWWVRLTMFLFAWVRLPWWRRDYDGDWVFFWRRPAWALWAHYDSKLQKAALANVQVEDIRIGRFATMLGPVPVDMFSPLTVGMCIRMPICRVEDRIEVVLTGKGGPLAVVGIGEMLV